MWIFLLFLVSVVHAQVTININVTSFQRIIVKDAQPVVGWEQGLGIVQVQYFLLFYFVYIQDKREKVVVFITVVVPVHGKDGLEHRHESNFA